ncbi:hypothetical protein [Virgibacillus sediminis]|uniref:Uncharacterized protein n=1 Tax=Virgibacillus sediminis TaxID=202260 RepID=A0ABV7A1K4_9BACI
MFARYGAESTLTSNARNHFATQYGIPTNRGMTDSPNTTSILGQKTKGYLIKQGTDAMLSAIQAIADGSIDSADVSIWDSLPQQYTDEGE